MTETTQTPERLPSSPLCSGQALFLAIHPEDVQLACGGTRQLHVVLGDKVSTLLMEASAGTPLLDYSDTNIDRVVEAITQCGAAVVYAPWPGEQDINHQTLALIAREAVRRTTGHCMLAQ